MITLDVADLVVIAGRTLGIGSDAALRQIDVAAAEAALTKARLTSSAIVDQDTAASAAIKLMHALLCHRPFPRHAEQIAVAAGLQFLSLNGWRADLDPPAAAAVVVEALARGQVTPVTAAAWLSPRLAAGRRVTAGASFGRLPLPRSERYCPELGSHWKPPSVIFAQLLLYVQAGCWATGMLGGVILYATALMHGRAEVIAAPLAAGWLAVAGGLAAAKLALGRRLGRGRTNRTRRAVIAIELAMAGFGVLWLTVPAYGVMMLGLSGAALSLAAALGMIGPRARRFFAGSVGECSTPEPGAGSDTASFWPLALAGGVRSREWSLAG
ncbi:MAG: hypothetical protein J2P28_05100 [Actinobacteria bacterium]|nr:hypothetical protein [Actinomycetota bacterium]